MPKTVTILGKKFKQYGNFLLTKEAENKLKEHNLQYINLVSKMGENILKELLELLHKEIKKCQKNG